TAAVGGILIPSMIRKGYPPAFSAAVTSSSATIGIIIPPSIPMIMHAFVAGVSVTTLFLAGLIPGILVGLAQIGVAYIISRRNFFMGNPRTNIYRKLSGATSSANHLGRHNKRYLHGNRSRGCS